MRLTLNVNVSNTKISFRIHNAVYESKTGGSMRQVLFLVRSSTTGDPGCRSPLNDDYRHMRV
jgi:hypothetical protein